MAISRNDKVSFLRIISVVYITVLLCLVIVEAAPFCYKESLDKGEIINRNYSTKTPYVHRQQERVTDGPRGCTAEHMWFLARHGSRYLKDYEIKNMNDYMTKLQEDIMNPETLIDASLCPQDTQIIRNWQSRMKPEDHMKLSETGKAELKGLGQRYAAKFPDLLGIKYEEDLFEFRHTDRSNDNHRTRDSARAFAEGAFGRYNGVTMIQQQSPDWLLQYYKKCDRYLDVKEKSYEEYDKFKLTSYTRQLIRDVGERVGLQGQFDYDNIYTIYDMCRVEYGVYGDSPWCALLTSDMIDIMEYGQDLKFYWRDGYGNELNYKQACPLLKDIFDNFEAVMNHKGKKFVGRFGHSANINTFLARLGLFRDPEHPRADSYEAQWDRKWRTTVQSPMASNIAFVLYKCSNSYVIKVYVNEQPVQLPRCGETCPYEMFVKLYGSLAENCNMDKICSGKASGLVPLMNVLMIVILTLIFHLL